MGARLFRLPGWGRIGSNIKLFIRRCVVASAGIAPLDAIYKAIYRMHVSYALRCLKTLPNTRSIYVARGVATGEIVSGVSDVDLVVIGAWSDPEQANVMAALRRLSALSPLYDASLWQHAHTIVGLHSLYATDLYYQCRFDQGRTQWKLLFGEDIIASLPPPPAERLAGGYYMDIRNWWDTFKHSAFGTGPTARDPIFRHSVAFKVVGEIVNKSAGLSGNPLRDSRKKAIADVRAQSTGWDRTYLERLERSAETRHQRFEGDIREETFQFLLRHLDTTHARIGAALSFHNAGGAAVRVDAPREEILLTAGAQAHANEVVAHVKRHWAGYRRAFLVPSISFFTLDDLMLLIELDPAQTPSVEQIRTLCRFHEKAALRQRVALLLLLEHGAVQVESVSPLELWHLVTCSEANPDVFLQLANPESAIDGSPRLIKGPVVWTHFAAALIDEEVGVRRAAAAAMSGDTSMTSIELVRNIWRQIQVEAVQRTQATHPVIPLTPRAVQRALARSGVPDNPALDQLREVYVAELNGLDSGLRPEDLGAIAGRAMMVLTQLP
jgi:predicted nucleotidyltransferase